MFDRVLIVNTHPGPNPEFVGKLADFLISTGTSPTIMAGYGAGDPLAKRPSRIILSGVPIDAPYSLAESDTQREIDNAFGWLREARCPVLGVCFGHQILARIFGGEVSSLPAIVKDDKLRLVWKADLVSGIFSGVGSLQVFAEHRDYVSTIPPGFRLLCQMREKPYIMFHPQREMYGVQFVPAQSDARSRHILKRFVEPGGQHG